MKKSTSSIIAAVAFSLGTAAGAQMADLPYHGNGHIMLNASELKWGDVGSMAPGAKIAIIEGELSKKDPFHFPLEASVRLPNRSACPSGLRTGDGAFGDTLLCSWR